MKAYRILESLKKDARRFVDEVICSKKVQIGSLLYAEWTKYNKEVTILNLLKFKFHRDRPYWNWDPRHFLFQGNRVVLGPYIMDLYTGNRSYGCPACNHPIKLDELRSKRESLGIFGDVEEVCCVYCVVPR